MDKKFFLELLDNIKKQTDSDNLKTEYFIKTIQSSIENPDIKEIKRIKKLLELERKNIKITMKNDNFTGYIKYDNIYREMISLIETLISYLTEDK